MSGKKFLASVRSVFAALGVELRMGRRMANNIDGGTSSSLSVDITIDAVRVVLVVLAGLIVMKVI